MEKKYFFSSSACVYNAQKQNASFIQGLKEEDAYPAEPEDGYGWEKLFSERMCRHFNEDFGLDVRIARYHNIYGPLGTFGKTPAWMLVRSTTQHVPSEGKEGTTHRMTGMLVEGAVCWSQGIIKEKEDLEICRSPL